MTWHDVCFRENTRTPLFHSMKLVSPDRMGAWALLPALLPLT